MELPPFAKGAKGRPPADLRRGLLQGLKPLFPANCNVAAEAATP